MKNFIILSISSLVFFGLLFTGLLKIQSNSIRPPFYYYPDGYVLNHHEHYSEVPGNYIDLDELDRLKKMFTDKNEINQKFSYYAEPAFYAKKKAGKMDEITFRFLEKDDITLDFIWDILISFLFLLSGVWLYYYVRDIYLFLLFLAISFFILLNFFILAFHAYPFFYFLSLFFLGFMILNLSFRFSGKEIALKWFFPQIALAILIAFTGIQDSNVPVTFYKLKNTGIHFILISSLYFTGSLLVEIYNELKLGNPVSKKVSLILAIVSVVIVPYSLLKYNLIVFHSAKIYYIISYAVFPFIFIFGTYKYSIVPIQLFFGRSIAIVYHIGLYSILYVVLFLFVEFLTPAKNIIFVLNLVFLVGIIYFMEPLQQKIFSFVNYWTFKRNRILSNTLDEISSKIASPISFKATIVYVMRIISQTLNVNRVMILIAGDRFPRMDPKNIYLLKISSNSEIWNYLTGSDEIIITSHLAYGSGDRESVYNFLKQAGIQLAYPMLGFEKDKKNSAVFLVGEKNDGTSFSLGELTFIKECSRIAELLLYNYSLLVNEVEKKKLVRDLNYASILDKTLIVYDPIKSTHIGFNSMPAVGISGDYLDIIKVSEDRILLFLGDVVGHGLGSGFLASAIRGLIRDQIRHAIDLPMIFYTINNFLKTRYSGHEFMSLIGLIYSFSSGEFEYINAGHSPMMIQDTNGIKRIGISQQILGITDVVYHTLKEIIPIGSRLVIYSDGIIEAFNENEIMYGMERFVRFLEKNIDTKPVQLAREIEKEMIQFRGERDQSDDISFVCIENKADVTENVVET